MEYTFCNYLSIISGILSSKTLVNFLVALKEGASNFSKILSDTYSKLLDFIPLMFKAVTI